VNLGYMDNIYDQDAQEILNELEGSQVKLVLRAENVSYDISKKIDIVKMNTDMRKALFSKEATTKEVTTKTTTTGQQFTTNAEPVSESSFVAPEEEKSTDLSLAEVIGITMAVLVASIIGGAIASVQLYKNYCKKVSDSKTPDNDSDETSNSNVSAVSNNEIYANDIEYGNIVQNHTITFLGNDAYLTSEYAL
jgi:hypothetical protein